VTGKTGLRIGIDVGGTALKAGLTDGEGAVLCTRQRPFDGPCGPERFAQLLAELARQVLEDGGAAMEAVEAVGIGIPGAVAGGRVLYACNIALRDVPLEALFRRRLDLPVYLGNDADCAAAGEYRCGTGRGCRDFVAVTLGTGVGAGLILNGRIYAGLGAAGEAGHMVTHPGGIPCTCGRRGCWEQYASAPALVRMAHLAERSRLDAGLPSPERSGPLTDGRAVFEAARRGDPAAKEACARYVEELALGITNLINLLHPEKLALGGGISQAPDELLLLPLRKLTARACYGRHCGKTTELVRAELGNRAGLVGAALLKDVS
jgi:glucokinase